MTAPPSSSSNRSTVSFSTNSTATTNNPSVSTTNTTIITTTTTTTRQRCKYNFVKSQSCTTNTGCGKGTVKKPSFGSLITAGIGGPDSPGKKKKPVNLMRLPKVIVNVGKYPKPRIVKDSIPLLDDELQVMTRDAPFIDSATPDLNICFFDRKEIIVGELLGQGQFAQVYEVKDFQLRQPKGPTSPPSLSSAATTPSAANISPQEQAQRQAFVKQFQDCPGTHKCHRYAIKHLKRDLLVSTARRRITTLRLQKRAGSHAIPEGDTDLPMDQQFQLAAADLVVEALYLTRLQHKHIITVRGVAVGGTTAFGNGRYDSYFLILDKLSETLDQRIRKWRHSMGQPQETQLMTKTYYAYQMAQALDYLHQRRIIFRDLKPSNIGFTEQNDQLQIFDFGLCRELPQSKRPDVDDPNEVYFMTAAGTHRYMAVEVLMGKQYNAKADVFSFALVFYELTAHEAPFLNFDDKHHKTLVCERRHRPHHFFGCVVPQSIHQLLNDAWEHEISERLTMSQVVNRLEDILQNTFQQTLREGPDGVKVLQE